MVTIGFCSTWGGCAYYRSELPARALAARGFNTWAAQEIDIDPVTGRFGFPLDEVHGFEPDVVILAAGHARAGAEVIRAARHHGQRIIVDCDDHPELPRSNPHWTANGAEEKLAAMRAAEAVIFSTAYLRENCELGRARAFVARNMIAPEDFEHARAVNDARRREGARTLRVGVRGLLGGFHDADIGALRGNLPTGPDIRYVHIGADPRASRSFATIAGLASRHVDEVQSVAFDEGYPDRLAGVDVALVPYDSRPFTQAKSNIAGLEWSAAGVPFMCSPHPEYATAEWLTASEWREWITFMASSASARAAVAAEQYPRYAGDRDVSFRGGDQWAAALLELGIYPERLPASSSGATLAPPQ